MYKYKYYNPNDNYDPDLSPLILEPYEYIDEPSTTVRIITAEYANALSLITDLEMRLRARLREVKKTLNERSSWDTKRNNEYADQIDAIIYKIVYNTLDLNETDFRHYGYSLRDVENGEGWWTYEEYSQSVKAYIQDAEGELKRVVDTYNEIAKEVEELLGRALIPKKRTWA